MNDTPWNDCKVAYDFNDADIDAVWDLIIDDDLPDGWHLNETDCTGARYVVIFQIDGTPTVEDGKTVKQLLIKVANDWNAAGN